MNIVAIIQARMASTRLPGKVLLDLCGQPVLARVVARTRRCGKLDDVLVATGNQAADDPIEAWCRAEGVLCVRGDTADVLRRYAHAAEVSRADAIVRITSDCPLIDPDVIGTVVHTFQGGAYDYVSNVIVRTFPRGLDTEVFPRTALERWDREVRDPEDREHVTRYARFHLREYRTASVTYTADHSSHRWTVDAADDLAFVRKVYEHFGSDAFSWLDLLRAGREYPEWMEINRHVQHKVPF